MIDPKNPRQTNGKQRPHCRVCGYGSRHTLYDYQVIRHMAKVHISPLGEAEEWNILDKQQEGDDSRCFYHLHATFDAVPLAEARAKEKKITERYAKRDAR